MTHARPPSRYRARHLAAPAQPAVLTTFGNPHATTNHNIPTGLPPGVTTLSAIDTTGSSGGPGPQIPPNVTGTAAATPAAFVGGGPQPDPNSPAIPTTLPGQT